MATHLEKLEKEVQIDHLSYKQGAKVAKIGPVDPEIIVLGSSDH